jgi:glycosyltransferase involved in cell wall biosynthesis
MSDTLKMSVGVLASNGAAGLALTLESILKQSVFGNAKRLDFEIELMVIACGCTDRAVETADNLIRQARTGFPEAGPVRLRLETVPESGCAGAWNLLAHTYSRSDADYIYVVHEGVVMDQEDAFEMMLRRLQRDYAMKVISPAGRKQFVDTYHHGLSDRLNLAVALFTEKVRKTQIPGPCFCICAPALRAIWLPKYFPGTAESCFNRMIASDLAASQDNPGRIGLATTASCTFEARRKIRDLYAGRVRWFVGQAFLEVLMSHLKTMRDEQPKLNLTAYLRVRDETDSSWLHRLVQLNIHVNGLFEMMPSPSFRFHFWRDPELNSFKKLGRLPIAVSAFIFDIPAFFSAAWCLKTGQVAGIADDTYNQNLRAR